MALRSPGGRMFPVDRQLNFNRFVSLFLCSGDEVPLQADRRSSLQVLFPLP